MLPEFIVLASIKPDTVAKSPEPLSSPKSLSNLSDNELPEIVFIYPGIFTDPRSANSQG